MLVARVVFHWPALSFGVPGEAEQAFHYTWSLVWCQPAVKIIADDVRTHHQAVAARKRGTTMGMPFLLPRRLCAAAASTS